MICSFFSALSHEDLLCVHAPFRCYSGDMLTPKTTTSAFIWRFSQQSFTGNAMQMRFATYVCFFILSTLQQTN
ncbi:hypothetical protein U9M48_029930 [Paspalum notatum var. saurae]|uniref:Uncharacterized protein n=1 Tax=Paspalum notatum var. saurae TaxID=547442 RepID=A0AAQ3TZ07_PASNO